MNSRKNLRKLTEYLSDKGYMDANICDYLDSVKADLDLLDTLMYHIKDITLSANDRTNIFIRLPEQNKPEFDKKYAKYKQMRSNTKKRKETVKHDKQ